ncbi:MAG: M6 family metalloprotease domain-containing protein [Bacteroidetes bacterium]|nr:M6 family metalloprotease domain-containing protein [Bacteroidota bacterium]
MRKKALFISALLLIITIARAAYFERLPYTITQPDGKTISCFVSGDEFFNWIHDSEGYTIIQASNGFYYYAVRNGDLLKPSIYLANNVDPASVGIEKWNKISKTEYQRRRDKMFKYKTTSKDGPSKAPLSGIINNLTVYIRFSDDAEFTTTRQSFDDKLNPATGVALKSYFKEVSYNNLTISSTHYPACALTTNLSYQDTHTRGYFQPYNATTNTLGYNNDADRTSREQTLLFDAITWINANSPVPGTLNIDSDGDNKVDNVCFIIKGNSDGWEDLLWSHRWSLYSKTVNINGKRVYAYTFQPENQVIVRTLCHEMFHTLGAPDLYHYNDGGLNISPVGSWDLMENGSGHMLAYMKWKYTGKTWINSVPEISTSGTYTLNPITSAAGNCYKIASPNSTGEYFMVEYRNKSGTFESNVPGSGLIVYRIDTSETGNASGPPDEIYIYRPGGTNTTNGTPNSAFFSSGAGRTSINDATDPGSFLQDGSAGELNISNITTAGSTISFDVTFGPMTFISSTATQDNVTSVMPGSNDAEVIGFEIDTHGSSSPINVTELTMSMAGTTNINDINNIKIYYTGLSSNFVASNQFGSTITPAAGSILVSGNQTLAPGTNYFWIAYDVKSSATINDLIDANVLTARVDGILRTPDVTNPGGARTIAITYCAAGSNTTSVGYISRVRLGAIDQTSTLGTAGYEDYTSQTANMQIGVNSTITVNRSAVFLKDSLLIWVDWNKDGDFLDTDENVFSSSAPASLYSTSFSPPGGAAIGTTRMRIRLTNNTYLPNSIPCGTSYYGEVEDYTINVIAAPCIPPAAPTIGIITQPTCTVITASVYLTGLPETGTWTINPGSISGTGTDTTISGLTADTTYNFIVTNETACTSVASENVVINLQPQTPAAPIIGTITQPSCAVPTASVDLTGLPATGTWTIKPDSITGSGTSTTISGLAADTTYNFTVTNDAGCISAASGDVVINTQPEQPATPVITLIDNILHSNAANGNQWYNQDGLISDAIYQDYTVSANGVYYVVVTLSACSSDTSNNINVVISGIEQLELYNSIIIYPNPASDKLIIEIKGNAKNTNFEIFNSIGKLVFKGNILEKAVIKTTYFSHGIYLIKFDTGKTIEFKKIIRK